MDNLIKFHELRTKLDFTKVPHRMTPTQVNHPSGPQTKKLEEQRPKIIFESREMNRVLLTLDDYGIDSNFL